MSQPCFSSQAAITQNEMHSFIPNSLTLHMRFDIIRAQMTKRWPGQMQIEGDFKKRKKSRQVSSSLAINSEEDKRSLYLADEEKSGVK